MIRERLQVYDWGSEGPGPQHDQHRESVLAHTSESATLMVSTPARSMQAEETLLRRRKLLNGRLRRRGTVEHWCKGPSCCTSVAHTLEQMDELVDADPGPREWVVHRWVGIERTVEWHLFWLMAHGLLVDAYLAEFATKSSAAPDPPDGVPLLALEDCDHDNSDGEEPDEHEFGDAEVELVDPVKDSTAEQRQSTYRANAVLWYGSKPAGRLWIFRQIIGAQQHTTRALINQSSAAEQVREARRRVKGTPPSYRVTRAAQLEFVKPGLVDYGKLLHAGDAWQGMPQEFATHDLSVHAFRSISGAACTAFQLAMLPYQHYPLKPYKLLSQDVRERNSCALEMVSDYKNTPCIMCPFWFRFMQKHTTFAALLSAEALADVACHAEHVDVDTISVECGNASIHRYIKKALQERVVHLLDISGSMIM